MVHRLMRGRVGIHKPYLFSNSCQKANALLTKFLLTNCEQKLVRPKINCWPRTLSDGTSCLTKFQKFVKQYTNDASTQLTSRRLALNNNQFKCPDCFGTSKALEPEVPKYLWIFMELCKNIKIST